MPCSGGSQHQRRLRRVHYHLRMLCADSGGSEPEQQPSPSASAFEAKQAMFDQENPIPFAGFVEANSQHIGGIGVLEGTAPNEIHLQFLERMQQLGLAIPDEYHTAEYNTPEALAEYGPILDWGKVTEQLDMETFLRDGVLVLKGVFTPEATSRLVASCENVQRQNDSWLDHDWHEPTQWVELGLNPPTAPPLTEAEKEAGRGGCQLLSSCGLGRIFRSVEANNPDAIATNGTHFGAGVLRDRRSIRWPKGRGYYPEHLPIMHDAFLLQCMCHPQMIKLHQALLQVRAENVFFFVSPFL
jgi:hypothetical protein